MGGNLCGVSTGEALSRSCAMVISNNALADFATGPQWYQDGMPDYVNQTDPTDQNADSTGCGMVFISWMMSQGYGLDAIAQTMVSFEEAGTLAQLYATLTGDSPSNAYPNFIAAVQQLPNGVTNDDPFGGAIQPAQLAHLAPWTVEMAGKVFAAILADIAAGKAPHQNRSERSRGDGHGTQGEGIDWSTRRLLDQVSPAGYAGQGDANAFARQRSCGLNRSGFVPVGGSSRRLLRLLLLGGSTRSRTFCQLVNCSGRVSELVEGAEGLREARRTRDSTRETRVE